MIWIFLILFSGCIQEKPVKIDSTGYFLTVSYDLEVVKRSPLYPVAVPDTVYIDTPFNVSWIAANDTATAIDYNRTYDQFGNWDFARDEIGGPVLKGYEPGFIGRDTVKVLPKLQGAGVYTFRLWTWGYKNSWVRSPSPSDEIGVYFKPVPPGALPVTPKQFNLTF